MSPDQRPSENNSHHLTHVSRCNHAQLLFLLSHPLNRGRLSHPDPYYYQV